MKKIIFLVFISLLAIASSFSQTDTTLSEKSQKHLARIDSMGGIKSYVEQIMDFDAMMRTIEIRRLAQNIRLKDSIAGILDSTGIYIYTKPIYNEKGFWPDLLNKVPVYFAEKQTPSALSSMNCRIS